MVPEHIKIQKNISSIPFSTCFLIENFDCRFENFDYRFLLSFSPCLLFDNFYIQFDNFIVGSKSIPKIVNSNVQIVVLQSEFFSVIVLFPKTTLFFRREIQISSENIFAAMNLKKKY